MAYSAHPGWALVHEPGLLLAHAGADELFAIEDVGDDAAAELLALWRAQLMRPARLSPAAADAFEQLKSAGIVRNLLEPRRAYALGVRFAGSPDPALLAELERALPAAIAIGAQDAADLVLVVRTDATLADVADEGYATLRAPHLLLDLAYGHTTCLGPLVFVGETACLACLAGRLSYYWGDLVPPPRPRMTEHPQLVAGLVALALENVLVREDRSLVNRTVAYDFAAHELRANSIYRLPMCPRCAPAPRSGSVALPWAGIA